MVDLSGRHGIVTRASSGISLAVAKALLQQGTAHDYPNGKFWFDRKQAKTTILNLNKSSEEDELLWKYSESILASINLETAVQGDKVMQDFELESLAVAGDYSQMVKAPAIASDYGSKDCVNLSPSTAVSRIKGLSS
jgi:hypothetical protein